MPRKNRSKRMRGGMWPFSSTDASSSLSTSDISSSLTGMWEKAKTATSSATGSASSWLSSSPATTTLPTVGGRRRRRRRGGGYSDNMSTTNLASRAASYTGSTVRAQAYVGGRTKKNKQNHKRTHRRHRRK